VFPEAFNDSFIATGTLLKAITAGFVSLTVFPEAISAGFIAKGTLFKAYHLRLCQLCCVP
jgi:hypothetical protein